MGETFDIVSPIFKIVGGGGGDMSPCRGDISSVASFLLLVGGGGKNPKCTERRKKITYNLYARASEASERLRNICIFRSQNTPAYIQSMQWYSTINDSMTAKTLPLRKIYEYASEWSERAYFFFCIYLL